MRKTFAWFLVLSMFLTLVSCGRLKPAELSKASGVSRHTRSGNEAAADPEDLNAALKDLAVTVYPSRMIRTDGGTSDSVYPRVTVLKTRYDLEKYTHENEGYYDFDPDFYDAATEYQEAFFETKSLLVAVIQSPSGSYEHTVRGVSDDGRIVIDRYLHAVDTDDEAVWHALLEIPQDADLLDDLFRLTVAVCVNED